MALLRRHVTLAGATALLGLACGGGGGGSGPAPTPNHMVLNGGAGQNSDSVDAIQLVPYSVRVLDSNNAPVQGVSVAWSVLANQGSVSSPTQPTDANGIAAVTRTLGPVAGLQTAQASASGVTGSPVTISAQVAAGVAFQIVVSSGNDQLAQPGHAVLDSLRALVGDRHLNPKSGEQVNWAAATGGGGVGPAQNNTGTNGIASTKFTLGAATGQQTVTATKSSFSPATFRATALSPPSSASVDVGNIFFKSSGNNSQNPAMDTIAVGGTVTWNWVGGTHSVRSTGMPSFTSSSIMASGPYPFTFANAGTYTYDCAVHGSSMTGTIVVVP